MARVELAVTTVTSAGVVPPAEQAASAENNFIPYNDGRVHLEIHNTGGAEGTVTILQPGVADGVGYPGKEIKVAAAATKLVGPLSPAVYNQPNGQVFVNSSAVTIKFRTYYV